MIFDPLYSTISSQFSNKEFVMTRSSQYNQTVFYLYQLSQAILCCQIPSVATMGGLQLEHCSHERDLGFWISTDLTWKKQVQTQSAKANKILGYVKRTTNSIKSIVTKRTSTGRGPSTGRGSSPVWAPQTVDNIKNIERIQRRATKYILGLPYRCSDTYKERLLQTDLIPLTYWQEYLDMVQLFKIITDITYVDKNIVPKVKKTRRSTRSGNNTDGIIVLEEELYRTSIHTLGRTW